MKHFYATILFITLLLPIVERVNAQERLIPDRPGFSTGTFTVPKGVIYIETGYQFSYRNSSANRKSEFPEINLRTGITSKSEVFVSWDGVEVDHYHSGTAAPLPSIGGKLNLLDGGRIDLTLLAVWNHSNIDGEYRIDPMAGVMWEAELNEKTGYYGGFQIESEPENNGRMWVPAFASGLEFELSEKLTTVFEGYTIYESSDRSFQLGLEAGLLFYPAPSVQLDLFGGFGLTDGISHYLGAGVSFRI